MPLHDVNVGLRVLYLHWFLMSGHVTVSRLLQTGAEPVKGVLDIMVQVQMQ
jgi:hypothetical protein